MTIGGSVNRRRLQPVAIALALIVGIASVVPHVPVRAAETEVEQESITLSPVGRDFKVDAGTQVKDELTIINDGKLPYDFIVYSRPYSVSGEDYKSDYTKVRPNTDVYQWVRFEKTKYSIKPNETIKVPYTVAVPSGAAPGGHYGVIFAETQPSAEAQGNAVVRKKRVGMIVYMTVNGTYINKGELLDVNVPFWQVQAPMSASLRVENTGNSDFKDSIRYTVRDLFGNVKYDAVKQYPVLPQTTRKIDLAWSQSPWFGLFKVEIAQKILDKEKTTHSYVLMMPRFIPILLFVLLIVGGGYALYRRRKK